MNRLPTFFPRHVFDAYPPLWRDVFGARLVAYMCPPFFCKLAFFNNLGIVNLAAFLYLDCVLVMGLTRSPPLFLVRFSTGATLRASDCVSDQGFLFSPNFWRSNHPLSVLRESAPLWVACDPLLSVFPSLSLWSGCHNNGLHHCEQLRIDLHNINTVFRCLKDFRLKCDPSDCSGGPLLCVNF